MSGLGFCWGHQKDNTESRCRTRMFIWAAQPGCLKRIFQTWVCKVIGFSTVQKLDAFLQFNFFWLRCFQLCLLSLLLKKFERKQDQKRKTIKLQTYPLLNSALRFLWGPYGQPSEVRAFRSCLVSLGHWIHLDGFNPVGCFQEWW